jgi:hypothetical protein
LLRKSGGNQANGGVRPDNSRAAPPPAARPFVGDWIFHVTG